MSRRTIALLSLITLMLVWGSTFVVTKAAMREIPPLTLAALRFVIAAVILVPIAIGRGGLKALPRPFPFTALAMMGLTGVALYHIAFNIALVHGSASQGALIFAVMPAAVAIAAVLGLGEKLFARRIVGIVLSVGGIALVVAGGEKSGHAPHPLLGALWMFGAVLAWAVYTVFAKKVASADQIVVIACATVFGVLLMIPVAFWEMRDAPWTNPSATAWLGALFLGVIASAVGFIVYGRALRELDASLVGVLVNLDPIVGVLTAVIFLGETLRVPHIVGGAVAVAGMWLASSQGAPATDRDT